MNTRLFENHKIRYNIPVPALWNFSVLDENDNVNETLKMLVPGCWESKPELSSYKGKGLYSIDLEFGGSVRLVFKGVSHTANVYVDGEHVAYHYNAYTEFDVVLKDMEYGIHNIEVKVDNTFHEDSSLHVNNDYYSYGGITRPVVVEQLKEVYIKNIKFIPKKENGKWFGKVTAILKNLSNTEIKSTLNLSIEENKYTFEDILIGANSDVTIEETFEFDNVETYTLDNPKLYYLESELVCNGDIIDDLIDRVGFREVKVKGTDVFFNDEKVIIKGVNRHEDYAEFGCAIPIEAMYRDIELIKELGANCVRTCHYPNDERFLDLCDEYGILVWEESHARGLSEDQMRHKDFDKQSADCIVEMIENHINHPSIFIWGLLNECITNTEFGRECHKKQIELIRSLDSSRPVSYAGLAGLYKTDMCLDLVDIVSYNLYPKWYENVSVKDYIGEFKEFISKSDGKGKPILISEIGAGAIYGYRSNNCEKWTEEYQEIVLEEQLTTILEDEDLCGVIIWQYADCRVEPGWFGVRPKSQNNKGLVDIYRREKMSYKKVQEIFKK